MKVKIERMEDGELEGLISSKIAPSLGGEDLAKFYRCLNSSSMIWGGTVNGRLVCIWGLAPPTLLSNSAYLWLEMIEDIRDCEFVFVRYSQRAIEEALTHVEKIVGHCKIGEDRSIRWIKWLGASFGEPEGNLIPFVIRRRR